MKDKQINLLEEFGDYRPAVKTLKYINDDPSQGIDYDWDLIFKEYKSLGIPDKFFYVKKHHIINSRYYVGLSARKLGKTTGWLLFGMKMFQLYGTEIQYMRRTEDELSPSFAMELVSTIRDYNQGEYIKKLTNGRYNDIYYHWKAFYYCQKDENGTIIAKSDRPFIRCLSLDKWRDYKSSYNAPMGDLIILDEFIVKGSIYAKDEFIAFMNNLDTIIRHRNSAHIVMLANTITNTNMYFDELSIGRLVKKMKTGDKHLFQSPKGTKLYVEFIDAKVIHTKENKVHNELYFGWDNPQMGSITGVGDWSVDIAPHIDEHKESREVIWNHIVIEFAQMEYIRLKYVYDIDGYHLEVTNCTRTYDSDILMGLDRVKHRYYGFGSEKMEKLLRTMRINNTIFYGTNELQDIFNDYMVRSAMEKRLI
ncbi:MAG: phage DNA encapsidation protein [archaeon]|nr:phage DNA encapsidation protein [archaeon]